MNVCSDILLDLDLLGFGVTTLSSVELYLDFFGVTASSSDLVRI